MLNASDAAWHEAQVRPLVPRFWKNGPVTLIALLDCALVSNSPEESIEITRAIGDAAAIAARESAPNVISFVRLLESFIAPPGCLDFLCYLRNRKRQVKGDTLENYFLF